LPSSESTHNFKPVIFEDSLPPKSPHNFKPIIFNDPKSPISPYTLKPIISTPGSSRKSPRKSKSVVFAGEEVIVETDVTAGASSASVEEVIAGPSSVPAASEPIEPSQPPPSPVATEFVPSEAEFFNPRPARFKTRFKPYVPRPPPSDGPVKFPNGLDGDNPYHRPYGGGWRNHIYHLYERLPRSKLLVDPYYEPKKPSFWKRLTSHIWKKCSSRNYYGGRSAAQRQSTRYVHRATNDAPEEEYEMDDLSAPKPESSDTPTDTPPKPFVGTAVSILQAVRRDVKVFNVKAKDLGGNVWFYEKAYVPRFTKHSLRPSKRRFSIRNFLNRRLYGRPGDGANLLMPHVPITVKIPGVDDIDRAKIIAEEKAKARGEFKPEVKQSDHPLGDLDWLNNFDLQAEMKKVRAAKKAQKKKEAKELKKTRKETRKVPGFVSRWQERREKEMLARAHKNYAKDLEEERKQKEKAAAAPSPSPFPSSPPTIHLDSDLVEHHEPAEASREAQEKQRALDMEEARRGKKKVSDPVASLESLRRGDQESADVHVGRPGSSVDDLVEALFSALKEHSHPRGRRIFLRLEADHAQRTAERQERERDELIAREKLEVLSKQVWRQVRKTKKVNGVRRMEEARRLVQEHIARKREEQLLAEQCFREQEAMEEESIDITPPRLRTPNRYRDCDFEEAEQLVTPKSPEQAQFEFNQAATPRTPMSYVLPSVEEEIDEEDVRQIIDLTDSFKEFF
jgi:hypothetical protein